MIQISEFRKILGISQKDLAKKLNVSAGNLCEWEKGRIEPSIFFLIKLADIFNISIDELVGRNTVVNDNKNTQQCIDIIYYYNQLDDAKKELVLNLIKALI